jgi:Galactose oxidase, central domain/Kelch motif
MTTNSLLRVTATVLFFVAACKSDFPAGSYDDGGPQDAPAQEAASGNPNGQGDGPAPISLVSCDPFQPATKPITLTTVLGAGQDTDGTLYVVDQPQAGSERVFVSSGGTLQRQRIAGSGTESSGNGVMSYTFSISDHVPAFMLKLETNSSSPTAMGVLQGDLSGKTFTIGQQGSVLTLVSTSQVAVLPVANIPAQTFIEYSATIPDGRALLVVRPRDDWTYQDFRVFFGTTDHMAERPVDQVVRYHDGGSTTINFTIDGVTAVASIPVSLTGPTTPPTLTIGATSFPLALGPTDSPPVGFTYFCLGNPSPDGGVDARVPPADGPATCRAPSPDYGPTSTFSFLPDGTPVAASTCPAACGDSAWPQGGTSFPNIDIALPYGSCTPGTPSCSTMATVPCACGGGGPVHGFNCSCESGNWICRIRSQGAALCWCPDAGVGSPDGGNDAAPALKGILVPTGSMNTARASHTATLLSNGKVLIAGGGYAGCLASAELYDPAAGTFTATGSMTTARASHTATLLPSGKVLIAGGDDCSGPSLASAELYDPATGTFVPTGSMTTAREKHTATLLGNGKVVIAGGLDRVVSFASAELYDPVAGTFTTTGNMTAGRYDHTATLLPSGAVLIAGGFLFELGPPVRAELYDPAAGTFTATGNMTTERDLPTATLLPSGKVLITGGWQYDANLPLSSAELYDSGTGLFTATGSLTMARSGHTATLLPIGKVLIAGGDNGHLIFASPDLYDPAAGTFTATGGTAVARELHTATLLPNGRVLIAGGWDGVFFLASAWLYQ